MQQLARLDYVTGVQRSTEEIEALLIGDSLDVRSGLELVNSDLTSGEDISDDLLAGTLRRSMYATIHGTCNLTLARLLPWGASLVRPYMVLSDAGVSARFDLGVYVLTTPERPLGATPVVYDVSGLDRL